MSWLSGKKVRQYEILVKVIVKDKERSFEAK
jgi:hypothetical protein